MGRMRPTREGYSEGLLAAGWESPLVVVLDADLASSIGSEGFGQVFPDRYFNVGISEQDMIGEAAGLALAGLIPFASTYGVFAAGRAWDQIRTTVCHNNLNVKIGGAHGGVSVGPDGATHQALEDLAIMRVLPGMSVLFPADASQTKACVLAASRHQGPVYIRFGRNPVPEIYPEGCSVEIGKADLLSEGRHLTIVAGGVMVSEALDALPLLVSRGMTADLINMVSVKPMDEDMLVSSAKKTGHVLVAEDHQDSGGLGGAVCELLCSRCPVPVERMGVPGVFGQSGSPEEVRESFDLTASGISRMARKMLERS
ncbi:transketolase family protein [Candidatus Fermentibacterales bacterium]|nr:transketolase family protein [Candidatus Fermentibacterales bacterium]